MTTKRVSVRCPVCNLSLNLPVYRYQRTDGPGVIRLALCPMCGKVLLAEAADA